MQFQKKISLALAALLAVALPAAAAGPTAWIHVAVDEGGGKGSTVRVNLPLAVVDAVVPLMSQEWAKHTKIDVGEKAVQKADIKAMLAAVRDVDATCDLRLVEQDGGPYGWRLRQMHPAILSAAGADVLPKSTVRSGCRPDGCPVAS